MTRLILPVVALLCGCEKEPHTITSERIRYDIGPRYVSEFRLQDGTRCVSVTNGITCDWRNEGVEKELPNE